MAEDIAALYSLPTLEPFLSTLSGYLSSPHPPPAILIHSPTNSQLVLPLLQHILTNITTTTTTTSSPPTIDSLLPNHAIVDLLQVYSPRQAFDRVLNQLAGWSGVQGEAAAAWDEARGAVSNWDGRVEGLHLVQPRPSKRKGIAGRDKGKGKKRARTEEEDAASIVQDSEEEQEVEQADEENAEQPRWHLEWDRSLLPPAGELGPVKDSVEAFHHSLRKILSLGADPSAEDQGYDDDDLFLRKEASSKKSKHRFIIFDHGEMLSDLAAPGNVGGAPKETGTGMTFEATVRRIGSLSRLPVTSIVISTVSVLKSRGDMVGLSEPTVLEFPDLGGVDPTSGSPSKVPDVVTLLTHRFASYLPAVLPTSSPSQNPHLPLDRDALVALFQSLASLVWDVFSKYLTEVDQLAGIVARLWPKWKELVERSNPPIAPTNTSTLASHLKPDIARERELLGLPQSSLSASTAPLSPLKSTSTTAAPTPTLHGFAGSMPDLPQAPKFLALPGSPGTSRAGDVFAARGGPPTPERRERVAEPVVRAPAGASSFYGTLARASSSSAAASTSGAGAAAALTSTAAHALRSSQTLSKSLPVIARYLLIAAFYASFNPAKSDVRHFVKVDENVAKKGKKGGRGRKAKIGVGTKSKLAPELAGGKAFPLERLLAIFEAIVSDRLEYSSMALSVDVGMQIASLISLRLLSRSSSSSNTDKLLDGVKLRSQLGREAVDVLARTVGFSEWAEFIWDGE